MVRATRDKNNNDSELTTTHSPPSSTSKKRKVSERESIRKEIKEAQMEHAQKVNNRRAKLSKEQKTHWNKEMFAQLVN